MAESIKHTASKLFLSTGNYATNANIQKIANNRFVFKVEPYVLHNDDPAHFVLGLEQASIPLSFWVISDTHVFSMDWGTSVYYNFYVLAGNYSIEDLLTALNAFLYGVVFTYNYSTSRITATWNSATYPSIRFTEPAVVPTSKFKWSDVLGFEPNVYNFSGIVFPSVVNLTTTSGVMIRLNNIITANKSAKGDGGGGSIIARLPITSGPNTYLQYFNPVVFYLTLSSRTINFFDVELLDDDYNALTFNLINPQWFIVLKIDYIEKLANQIPQTLIQNMRNSTPQVAPSIQNIPAPKPQT